MSQTRSERNRWVSPQYVAEFFDVTDRTVINWIKRGDVRARRVGPRVWRVHSSVLTGED